MSYSLAVTGKSKHEAIMRAQQALAQQLASMPDHGRDSRAAMDSVRAHVEAMDEPPPGRAIVVEASGYTTVNYYQVGTLNKAEMAITGVRHQVAAYLVDA